jgi:hypothetical protein
MPDQATLLDMSTTVDYQFLERRPRSAYRQLFIKGTGIRAEVVYRSCTALAELRAADDDEPRTPEQVAEDYQLPLPMIQKSIDAFRRDLPHLLKTHPGKWVAYHGDERVGFGRTETELYQRCFARGLTRDDFIVGFTKPGAFEPDGEIEDACRDV